MYPFFLFILAITVIGCIATQGSKFVSDHPIFTMGTLTLCFGYMVPEVMGIFGAIAIFFVINVFFYYLVKSIRPDLF